MPATQHYTQMGKEKEKLRKMLRECERNKYKIHIFTGKSDLPAAEALFEIFVDFPETGKSKIWALETWEWKKCQWLQDDVKSSREALSSPATFYQEVRVAPHFGAEPPTRGEQKDANFKVENKEMPFSSIAILVHYVNFDVNQDIRC